MASISHTYTKASAEIRVAEPRARYGGSRRSPATISYERNEYMGITSPNGSHMPLDTIPHWDWRNPLNILPGLILVLVAIALIGMVLV